MEGTMKRKSISETVTLTEKDVERFVRLYERKTGVRLDSPTARREATKLILFVKAVVRGINRKQDP